MSILRDGDLLVVQKDHIRSFADTDYAIAVKTSQQLLELVTIATSWEDIAVPVCKSPMMRGVYPEENLDETLTAAMRELKNSKQFPLPSMPGSVKKQKAIVDDILDEYNGSDVVINGEGDLVINALKYVAKLKDPVSFINKQANNQDGLATRDVFAWTMFQSTFQLLRQFNAIESNTTIATDLGDMISSLTADNELWLAIVLSHSSVLDLNAGELGALINGVVVDGYKASNAYFKDKPTETLQVNINFTFKILFS